MKHYTPRSCKNRDILFSLLGRVDAGLFPLRSTTDEVMTVGGRWGRSEYGEVEGEGTAVEVFERFGNDGESIAIGANASASCNEGEFGIFGEDLSTNEIGVEDSWREGYRRGVWV